MTTVYAIKWINYLMPHYGVFSSREAAEQFALVLEDNRETCRGAAQVVEIPVFDFAVDAVADIENGAAAKRHEILRSVQR